jgi:hypothetical protein
MAGAVEWAALRVLMRELGTWRALRIGAAVQLASARGEPFRQLPPPADTAERASRAQAGPAILLYDRLANELGDERALALTAAVVEASALVFLGRSVGPLHRDQLADGSAEARLAFVRERLARFPNATATVDEASADRVRFTVTACHLERLARETGRPALAPLFCAADGRYFGEVQPGVRLDRPTTLAQGGATCPFTLEWEDP